MLRSDISILGVTKTKQGGPPRKQLRLIALNSLKKPARCSGNSAKSWLIMLSVGSNTASRIAGT